MRRLPLVVVGGLAAATLVGLSALPGLAADPTSFPDPSAATPSTAPVAGTSTVAIERRTLTISDELDGELGYAGEWQAAAGAPGTVTRLPAVGTLVERGTSLFEVDGARTAVLLYGERPAWRRLDDDVDGGHDVRQLEQNLYRLGYLKKSEVNNTWDAQTTAAVKKLEKAAKLEVDGVLELGDIVFLPGPVRIASHVVEVGASVGPGAGVLGLSGTGQAVSVDLAVGDLDLVALDAAVEVTLPDGTTVPGTVTAIGREVEASSEEAAVFGGEGGDPTIEVTITLDAAGVEAAAAYDAAPVEITVVTEAREQVLSVPVSALVALLEGGYALEVVGDDGSTSLVAVEPGLFDGGWVEIRGDIAEGQRVVVPS